MIFAVKAGIVGSVALFLEPTYAIFVSIISELQIVGWLKRSGANYTGFYY